MFMIATQKYNCLINMDTVRTVCVSGNKLVVRFTTNSTELLVEFRTYREAQDVAAMMCSAYAAGDETFKIPEQEELQFVHQHSSQFSGRQSHGKS